MTPEMILFDYGGTLLYEPDFCPSAGNTAIYPYISENPHNISEQEFSAYLLGLFDEIKALRGDLIEIHEHIFLRYVLTHFDMRLSVSIEEAEQIMWNGISSARMTPGADAMLAAVREKGIRTGIISNLCWSGAALTERLHRFFPEHKFEFVMTSSEYIFRKPETHIFDLAVRRSGLSPDRVWFCGNDIAVDVFGAAQAGLFPVFYDDRSVPSLIHAKNDPLTIDFPHHHIRCWEELSALL